MNVLALTVLALLAASTGPVAPCGVVSESEYWSDFVSFAGADAQGRVAFALDTNRGREGVEFQAEHFCVLYDEGRGWVELAGNGAYDNSARAGAAIPDSKHFAFTGAPRTGWKIRGDGNGLELAIEPISIRTRRALGGAEFDTGSAAAILTWKGRKLAGRAIYERNHLPDKNLIMSPESGLFGDGWNAIYALVDGKGDLRVHQSGGDIQNLLEHRAGFLELDGKTRILPLAVFEARNWSQGGGFYQWPGRWIAKWKSPESAGRVEVTLEQRNVVFNWVFGGFAVALVRGELKLDGEKHELWGLAQIVR